MKCGKRRGLGRMRAEEAGQERHGHAKHRAWLPNTSVSRPTRRLWSKKVQQGEHMNERSTEQHERPLVIWPRCESYEWRNHNVDKCVTERHDSCRLHCTGARAYGLSCTNSAQATTDLTSVQQCFACFPFAAPRTLQIEHATYKRTGVGIISQSRLRFSVMSNADELPGRDASGIISAQSSISSLRQLHLTKTSLDAFN